MAPITPKGAYSSIISPPSPEMASVVRHSTPGVLSATARCFSTLSSIRPMPVSSRTICASVRAFSLAITRMASITRLRSSTL